MPQIDIAKFRFSKSSMNMLTTCPMSFKLKYIDKHFVKGSYIMDQGTEAHKNIVKYEAGVLTPAALRSQQKLYLENYIKTREKYRIEKPWKSDHRISTTIDGLIIGGEIDAVYGMQFADGKRHMVIDYKTSKDKSIADPSITDPLEKYRFELQLYSYAFREQGFDVRRYGIIFLAADGGFQHEPDEHKYEAMHAGLAEVKRIIADDTYPAIRNKYCSSCGVNAHCKTYLDGVFEKKLKKASRDPLKVAKSRAKSPTRLDQYLDAECQRQLAETMGIPPKDPTPG